MNILTTVWRMAARAGEQRMTVQTTFVFGGDNQMSRHEGIIT